MDKALKLGSLRRCAHLAARARARAPTSWTYRADENRGIEPQNIQKIMQNYSYSTHCDFKNINKLCCGSH
jgi:hypothetical protein